MPKKVMMVDDSRTTRSMVAFTLRRAGYEVMEADDGTQALAAIGGDRLDCVITDLNMPGMDGLELIRRLRASPVHATMPILMLSTATDLEKKEEGRMAGANAWLGKPFHPANLVKMVESLV
jgi:two-component system chemotaxis response regulator CheY